MAAAINSQDFFEFPSAKDYCLQCLSSDWNSYSFISWLIYFCTHYSFSCSFVTIKKYMKVNALNTSRYMKKIESKCKYRIHEIWVDVQCLYEMWDRNGFHEYSEHDETLNEQRNYHILIIPAIVMSRETIKHNLSHLITYYWVPLITRYY